MAKLGFIADLISKPTMIGYLNGLALTILIGQLPKLLGFKVETQGLIREATELIKGLAGGKTVAVAAVVGIAGIAVILVLQRWLPKVPAVLVMVVLAIAATSVFHLADHPPPLLPNGRAAVAAFRAETGAEWLAVGDGASTQHGQATPLTGGNRDGQQERQE